MKSFHFKFQSLLSYMELYDFTMFCIILLNVTVDSEKVRWHNYYEQ